MLEPELILPRQMYDPKNQTAFQERRLWTAVLEDALHQAQRPPSKYDRPRREAIWWIETPSYEVGGFDWVCELLELSPARVREAVQVRRIKQVRNCSSKYEARYTQKVNGR